MVNIKHIATNLIGSAIPIIVILISVPFYLNTIGAEKYGALSLVWVVFGYFGIFDFGVSRAVTSAVSRVRENHIQKSTVIWSATALTLGVGVAVALAAGLAFYIYAAFSQNKILEEVLQSLPLMMVGIPVLTVTSTLNGAIDGEERFKTSNLIQVTGSILYQIFPLIIARLITTDLSTLINTVIICRIVVLLIYIASAVKIFSLASHIAVSKKAMSDLLKFGSGVTVINFIDPLFNRIDQLFIAKYSGIESVTAYNIAINSIGRLGIFPMALSRSLFPKLSMGAVEDFKDELHNLKFKVMIIWFFICVSAILTSNIIFGIWLHNAIAPEVSRIAKVYIIGLWAGCLGILPYTALQASGRSNAIIKAHIAELPLYLVSLVFLTRKYGPIGAASAYSARMLIDYVLLWKICHFPLHKQKVFAVLFVCLVLLVIVMR